MQVVAHDSLDPVSSSHQDMHLRSASRNAALDWFASDHAGHARWLVHATDYAIVSTNSTMKEGWPFSNVVSISDGAAAQSTGRIIIYVATMSQFAADVEADSKVSVGVSQAQANGGQGCKYIDVEWPMCARVRRLPPPYIRTNHHSSGITSLLCCPCLTAAAAVHICPVPLVSDDDWQAIQRGLRTLMR